MRKEGGGRGRRGEKGRGGDKAVFNMCAQVLKSPRETKSL